MTTEKSVEGKVVKHAKKLGCLARKMNGLGNRGWPDRMFVFPSGFILWIEFKAPGKKLVKGSQQQVFLDKLRFDYHQPVWVADNVEDGIAILESYK